MGHQQAPRLYTPTGTRPRSICGVSSIRWAQVPQSQFLQKNTLARPSIIEWPHPFPERISNVLTADTTTQIRPDPTRSTPSTRAFGTPLLTLIHVKPMIRGLPLTPKPSALNLSTRLSTLVAPQSLFNGVAPHVRFFMPGTVLTAKLRGRLEGR